MERERWMNYDIQKGKMKRSIGRGGYATERRGKQKGVWRKMDKL